MKSLVEFIKENLQINESLKSSILNDVVNQLKAKDAKSFKSLFGDMYRIRMSEVTDDDFEIFNDVKFSKDMVDFLTSIIKGAIFDGKYYLTFVREPNKGEFLWFVDSDGTFIGLTDDTSASFKIGAYADNYKIPEKKSFIKGNDLYCLPIDKKQRDSYNKIVTDRYHSKEGMVDMTPEGLQKIADENINKYKEILANNALDNGKVSDKTVDKVYDLIDEVNKLARRAAKDWNKYEHEDYKYDALTALNELILAMNDVDKERRFYRVRGLEKLGIDVDDGDFLLLKNLNIYAKEISKEEKNSDDERYTTYVKKYRDELMKSYNDCKKAYDVISSKID